MKTRALKKQENKLIQENNKKDKEFMRTLYKGNKRNKHQVFNGFKLAYKKQ